MKSNLFLIAGICFYAAAFLSFFAFTDNKAVYIGAFSAIATAFIVIHKTKRSNK